MESWSFNMSVRVSPVLGSNGTRCTFRMVNTGGNRITVISLKLLNNMSGFIWIHCVDSCVWQVGCTTEYKMCASKCNVIM